MNGPPYVTVRETFRLRTRLFPWSFVTELVSMRQRGFTPSSAWMGEEIV